MDNQKIDRILLLFKSNPDNCMVARKIDHALGFKESIKKDHWPTYKILNELARNGDLEKRSDGFRYKRSG